MSYQYDLFISYKWRTDRKDWVEETLLPILRQALSDEMGVEASIFKDTNDIVSGQSIWDSLKDAVAGSKCMISVITLPYFMNSMWCPKELFSMVKREADLQIRQRPSRVGLIFPIIFVNEKAARVQEQCPIYAYDRLRDLIFGIAPLQLDKARFNFTNKAFKESDDYNKLATIIQSWVAKSIVPALRDAPPYQQEWRMESYFDAAYTMFTSSYAEAPRSTSIPRQ